MFTDYLGRLSAGIDLTMEEAAEAIGAIMSGECSEGEIATLLTALRAKGETVAEVAGAAAAMRKHMTPIRCSHTICLDTCGTGGDGSGTFNISTAAALVTAAAGVPVAKHGNRAVTSRTGSADALAALGVNVEANVAQVEACLEELGICFCFAPLLHASMRNVAAVRKKLGFPTIFNLLGPLSNPAGAGFQLIGVGKPELRSLLAEALVLLGTERSLVVHGDDGLDEVTLGAETQCTLATPEGLSTFSWRPADFSIAEADREAMLVDGPQESAEVIRRVISGEPGTPRDIVVINAAAALWTAGRDEQPARCAELAADAIDQGAARELLARLVEVSHR